MRKVVLVILVDGLRYDYISHKSSPFLTGLIKEGMSGKLIPPFTFSLSPTWFAGLYPENSGYWISPWYSPSTSIWKFFYPFSLLIDNIPVFRSYCNLLGASLSKVKETIALNAPINIARYFDYPQKIFPWDRDYIQDCVTLFDVLRMNNLNWLFIGSPSHNVGTLEVYEEFKKSVSNEFSLIFLHFGETDWAGHKFGPTSSEVFYRLKEIDNKISSIVDILNGIFDEIDLLVFGDHGMVEVKKVIDIESILKRERIKLFSDYLFFLGATTARFWFKGKNSRQKVEEILRSYTNIKILNEVNLDDIKCKFNHNKYGDLICVAKEGTIFSPNFFDGSIAPKGMHGYLPGAKDNQAAFIISSSYIEKPKVLQKPHDMVDLFPTLLDILDLSPIPGSNQGETILYATKNWNKS